MLLFHYLKYELGSIVTTPTQPQLNSKVGCDTRMTLIHHPPPPTTTTTQTQCQPYLSCYCPNFNQTLKLGSWDEQQQQQQQQQRKQQ